MRWLFPLDSEQPKRRSLQGTGHLVTLRRFTQQGLSRPWSQFCSAHPSVHDLPIFPAGEPSCQMRQRSLGGVFATSPRYGHRSDASVSIGVASLPTSPTTTPLRSRSDEAGSGQPCGICEHGTLQVAARRFTQHGATSTPIAPHWLRKQPSVHAGPSSHNRQRSASAVLSTSGRDGQRAEGVTFSGTCDEFALP